MQPPRLYPTVTAHRETAGLCGAPHTQRGPAPRSSPLGKLLALALDRPEDFIGPELEIAGGELANRRAAEVFARVLGRPVKFRRLPMPIVRVALGKEFFQMFHWFNDSGCQADVKGLRARHPELQLRTLEDWPREEGWRQMRDNGQA